MGPSCVARLALFKHREQNGAMCVGRPDGAAARSQVRLFRSTARILSARSLAERGFGAFQSPGAQTRRACAMTARAAPQSRFDEHRETTMGRILKSAMLAVALGFIASQLILAKAQKR